MRLTLINDQPNAGLFSQGPPPLTRSHGPRAYITQSQKHRNTVWREQRKLMIFFFFLRGRHAQNPQKLSPGANRFGKSQLQNEGQTSPCAYDHFPNQQVERKAKQKQTFLVWRLIHTLKSAIFALCRVLHFIKCSAEREKGNNMSVINMLPLTHTLLPEGELCVCADF